MFYTQPCLFANVFSTFLYYLIIMNFQNFIPMLLFEESLFVALGHLKIFTLPGIAS